MKASRLGWLSVYIGYSTSFDTLGVNLEKYGQPELTETGKGQPHRLVLRGGAYHSSLLRPSTPARTEVRDDHNTHPR